MIGNISSQERTVLSNPNRRRFPQGFSPVHVRRASFRRYPAACGGYCSSSSAPGGSGYRRERTIKQLMYALRIGMKGHIGSGILPAPMESDVGMSWEIHREDQRPYENTQPRHSENAEVKGDILPCLSSVRISQGLHCSRSRFSGLETGTPAPSSTASLRALV